MMTTDAGWFNWFVSSLWFPMVAALLIQMSVTQWVKMYVPRKWAARRRRSVINALAFVSGFTPAIAIMLQMNCDRHMLWLAVVIGFCGPAIYKLATRYMYSKWPQLEGRLSSERVR
jgi:Na+/H+ antiporter NhaD/arsenite permease-like protein